VGKKYGYPFFTLYEEKSGINSNFPGIHNVGHLIPSEVSRELTTTRGFPVEEFNAIDQKTSFVPVSLMEKLLGEIKTAAEI
jgi:hypothetical protein